MQHIVAIRYNKHHSCKFLQGRGPNARLTGVAVLFRGRGRCWCQTAVWLCVAGSTAQNLYSSEHDINCDNDGVHHRIDLNEVSLKYTGTSFSSAINSIQALGAHLEVRPQTLQVAALATQQWDVFLKGLVEGFNKCAVTKREYNEGLNRIYPRLGTDSVALEKIREDLAAGRKANEIALQKALAKFLVDMRKFADVSNQTVFLGHIENFVHAAEDHIVSEIRNSQEALSTQVTGLSSSIGQIQEALKQVPTPAEVERSARQAAKTTANNELARQLNSWTDLALSEYQVGYDLLQRFSFSDALPHLTKAHDAVRLPEFSLALATALRPLLDLKGAEAVLRSGLSDSASIQNEAVEARLRAMLSRVLRDKGDLPEAQTQAELAVQLSQSAYGVKSAEAASAQNDLGMILYTRNDFAGALLNVQSALDIHTITKGQLSEPVATDKGNLGIIYLELGNLGKAEELLRDAMDTDLKLFGPNHITVAADYGNLSNVLIARGDLLGALRLAELALKINTDTFGPDHPAVALDHLAYSEVLRKQGRIEDAKKHFEVVLSIYRRAYGESDEKTKALTETFNDIFGKS